MAENMYYFFLRESWNTNNIVCVIWISLKPDDVFSKCIFYLYVFIQTQDSQRASANGYKVHLCNVLFPGHDKMHSDND